MRRAAAARRGDPLGRWPGRPASLGFEGVGRAEPSPLSLGISVVRQPVSVWLSSGKALPPRRGPFDKAKNKIRQFLAVDHSARASMKNAASCEN